MRRQHFADQHLEFFHHFVRDGRAFFLGERLLQRAALVHGGGGDHATFVRYCLHSGEFAGGKFHKILQNHDLDEFDITDNSKLKRSLKAAYLTKGTAARGPDHRFGN